ncbi:MAG: hypothetical protein AVDCRST_MAG85-979 [uncultured Solirubrobacteraceae bacterium]|uniref:L,D-TPase catalytic domain-containing protein n=1 Tax=uncultured Solirubrobacteraceae bacterium TaxID=1162706 RepID=A0A6J4S9E8_9ACTN|nr:MAG: hypothetical protein AVDCRST_MAG85-979 [uncultured Solirubrobacteraceae bacterium]
MRRLAVTAILLLLAVVGGYGVLAYADTGVAANMAPGTRVEGIEVSGLTRSEALRKLRGRIGPQIGRPAEVRLGARTFSLDPEEAGVRIDLPAAVDRAFAAGRSGNVLERGWRTLSGGSVDHDEPARIRVDASAVRTFVGEIHREIARKPVEAKLDLEVDRVDVTKGKAGRRLTGRDDLAKRITAALQDRSGKRTFTARAETVKPKVTEDELFDRQPVAVTVSRAGTTVRVFRRAKLVRTYKVAVGEPKYPTPPGSYVVQAMSRNPTWNVPNSDWAGDLAGKTIPPGDPRNPLVARFIHFNGAVGFHGTKSVNSLGSAASHGCVRMTAGDVIDLFDLVQVGTPVLVV